MHADSGGTAKAFPPEIGQIRIFPHVGVHTQKPIARRRPGSVIAKHAMPASRPTPDWSAAKSLRRAVPRGWRSGHPHPFRSRQAGGANIPNGAVGELPAGLRGSGCHDLSGARAGACTEQDGGERVARHPDGILGRFQKHPGRARVAGTSRQSLVRKQGSRKGPSADLKAGKPPMPFGKGRKNRGRPQWG
jgi:hypothetical protein